MDQGLGDLRHDHGGHGEVVCAGSVETLRNLLGGGFTVVLNVSIFGVAVEGIEIQELGDVGVGGWAVVTFVEVISQNFPVVVSLELIGMIQIIVFEVVVLVSLLRVDVLEMFFPRNLGDLLCIEVNPDEAVHVNLDVNSEQVVLVLVEAIEILIPGRLGEFAVQSI